MNPAVPSWSGQTVPALQVKVWPDLCRSCVRPLSLPARQMAARLLTLSVLLAGLTACDRDNARTPKISTPDATAITALSLPHLSSSSNLLLICQTG